MTKSKTIVLIHGNFVNNTSWTDWKRYYEQKGYTVYTPANPGHDGNPADLRNNVHPDLIKTGFIDVVNNISKLIDSLSGKAINYWSLHGRNGNIEIGRNGKSSSWSKH